MPLPLNTLTEYVVTVVQTLLARMPSVVLPMTVYHTRRSICNGRASNTQTHTFHRNINTLMFFLLLGLLENPLSRLLTSAQPLSQLVVYKARASV